MDWLLEIAIAVLICFSIIMLVYLRNSANTPECPVDLAELTNFMEHLEEQYVSDVSNIDDIDLMRSILDSYGIRSVRVKYYEDFTELGVAFNTKTKFTAVILLVNDKSYFVTNYLDKRPIKVTNQKEALKILESIK